VIALRGGAADHDVFAGLSRRSEEEVRLGQAEMLTHNQFMAYWAYSIEIFVTSGGYERQHVHRVELWEMDYRLVMPPTFHVLQIAEARQVVCVLAGEMIPVREGERNAIIITQGGAK